MTHPSNQTKCRMIIFNTLYNLTMQQLQNLSFIFSSFSFSLTEAIEGLQTYVEDLQTQVEELKAAQAERNKRDLAEQRRSLGAQSVSCLKELYDLHHDRYYVCLFVFVSLVIICCTELTAKQQDLSAELFSERKLCVCVSCVVVSYPQCTAVSSPCMLTGHLRVTQSQTRHLP